MLFLLKSQPSSILQEKKSKSERKFLINEPGQRSFSGEVPSTCHSPGAPRTWATVFQITNFYYSLMALNDTVKDFQNGSKKSQQLIVWQFPCMKRLKDTTLPATKLTSSSEDPLSLNPILMGRFRIRIQSGHWIRDPDTGGQK